MARLQEEKLLDVCHPPRSRAPPMTVVPPPTLAKLPRTRPLSPLLPPPGRQTLSVQVAPSDPDSAQINFQSLAGQLALNTLRMLGSLFSHQVVVLVDGRSTHNFIQQELVTLLQLPCHATSSPLQVMVGNGQHLQCTNWCEAITIDIQSSKFIVDLHVLPIFSANVVLGIPWLKSLGHVLTDYNTLTMQFIHEGRVVELKGDTDGTLNIITLSQFRCIA